MQESKTRLINIMAKHTGQKAEKVRADMERNFYLSSSEAKDYGIIDSVLEHRKQ